MRGGWARCHRQGRFFAVLGRVEWGVAGRMREVVRTYRWVVCPAISAECFIFLVSLYSSCNRNIKIRMLKLMMCE